MPRSTVQKAPAERPLLRASGVVRMARRIPVMIQPPKPAVAPVPPKQNVCMGRCGHCDVHPCQLHTTV